MSTIHSRTGTILTSPEAEAGTKVTYTLTHGSGGAHGSISRRARTPDRLLFGERRFLRTENGALVEVLFTTDSGRFQCVEPAQAQAAIKLVIATVTNSAV